MKTLKDRRKRKLTLHPLLIRRDRRAFDPDLVLLDGLGGVDCDLVVCLVGKLSTVSLEIDLVLGVMMSER